MSASSVLRRLARLVRSQVPHDPGPRRARPARSGRVRSGESARGDATAGYPGDFHGAVETVYSPELDGDADPGEIVWTWVPYEEDHSRGKDRPVLVVGHDGPWLLALMLTSRDHDARPARSGESWLDLGTGDWDARRRPSEVRVDRVIRVDPLTVRREGAILDRARFDQVAAQLASL